MIVIGFLNVEVLPICRIAGKLAMSWDSGPHIADRDLCLVLVIETTITTVSLRNLRPTQLQGCYHSPTVHGGSLCHP